MATEREKEIQSLVSKLYIRSVQHRLGGISLGNLQKFFVKSEDQSNGEFWSSSSRRFYKTAQGSPIRDLKLIDKIEAELPGSRYILVHPLWDILRRPKADSQDVITMMLRLQAEFRELLFKSTGFDGGYSMKALDRIESIQKIASMNNLSALACLLLLLRKKELEQKWHQYLAVKWSLDELLHRITYFAPVSYVSDELNKEINESFVILNYPLPKNRVAEQFEDFFKSPKPYLMEDAHAVYSRVLETAMAQGLVSDQSDSQLRFLFLVDELGLVEVYQAMLAGFNDHNSPILRQLAILVRKKHILRRLPRYTLLRV